MPKFLNIIRDKFNKLYILWVDENDQIQDIPLDENDLVFIQQRLNELQGKG